MDIIFLIKKVLNFFSQSQSISKSAILSVSVVDSNTVYSLNAKKAEQAHNAILNVSGLPPDQMQELTPGTAAADLAVYKRNLARREATQAKLLLLVGKRHLQVASLTAQLRKTYDQMQKNWEGSLARRERERDARLARKLGKVGGGEGGDEAGAGAGRGGGRRGDPAVAGLAIGSSSRSRSIGSFDVVRPEHEMGRARALTLRPDPAP